MVYILGLLIVNEEVEETEVPVVVGISVITDELKPRGDDEVRSAVADAEVEFAATGGMIPSAVVTLAGGRPIIVDTGFVDLRNGGPEVGREVVEETLIGNNVPEGIGVVVVLKLSGDSVLDDNEVMLSTVKGSTDSLCDTRSVGDVVKDGD